MERLDDTILRIAGSIVMSERPAAALKSWRLRLNIRQVDLAKKMNISPSVLSDYENGRRPSPGVAFVKRYLQSLLELGKEGGHLTTLNQLDVAVEREPILVSEEYEEPVEASRVIEALEAQVLAGSDLLSWRIYGYTVLDSIRTIYSLSGFGFYRIFGSTTERVLVFTKVGLGRSPLVAIRVSQLKPRMVILHGPKAVDPLAIDLARRERIILGLSQIAEESELASRLSKLSQPNALK
ncbi:MAG: helix-turn-helix domain-containing protein [Nitrososphaerales archaeon]